MDFEERERQKRRQMISVVIAEIGMFLSVVAIVVIATLAAMGFFVTSEGTIEQTGLMQIRSIPTGASVELDGSMLFSKTNLTRSLAPGEHSLKLARDGYDTWEKTIKMYSGVLVRLYYPRIFLNNRTPEAVTRLGQDLEFFEPSRDYSYILYQVKNSTVWQLMNIRGDEIKTSTLDLAEVLPGVERKNFNGEITYFKWSENSDRVLIRVAADGSVEWILVDLRDVKKSLNLTRTFGLNFTDVEMVDDSATQLFALENQQLRKINISEQAMSRVLLSGVEDFAVEGANILYVMTTGEGEKYQRMVGVYKDGEKGGTTIVKLDDEDQVKIALSKYYDEDYMTFVVNDKVSVYYGTLPSYRENAGDTEFLNFKVLLEAEKLLISPREISVSEEGEFLAMNDGNKFAVVDFEMGDLHEYEAAVDDVRWLSKGMMFATKQNKLEVWDFDYANRRVLLDYDTQEVVNPEAEKNNPVTTWLKYPIADYPVTISSNNKWLFYIVDSNGELVLYREKIRD